MRTFLGVSAGTRGLIGVGAVLFTAALAGCGRSEARPRQMHYLSLSYTFTVVPDQAPPHAREPILYKILIRDRKSREPIQNGEGQIYSNNAEGARTWDGFTYGPEVGTYYGKLNYVTAGVWAVGMRFRRDSLHRLESIEWMQDVLNERPTASTP
jgi:hypothetical protein